MSEELWQQQVVREKGMCGELVADGTHICILPMGHAEPHDPPSEDERFEVVRDVIESLRAELWERGLSLQPDVDEALAVIASIQAELKEARDTLQELVGQINEPTNVIAVSAALKRARTFLQQPEPTQRGSV